MEEWGRADSAKALRQESALERMKNTQEGNESEAKEQMGDKVRAVVRAQMARCPGLWNLTWIFKSYSFLMGKQHDWFVLKNKNKN